jgi:hypothetical protein
MAIVMECPVKVSEIKRSRWSFSRRSLPSILLIALPGGILLGLLIALAYHPVMVLTHNGEWCARFDANGKLEAFKYGKACQAAR